MVDTGSYIEKCWDDIKVLDSILSTGRVQLDECQAFAYWYKRYLFERQSIFDRKYSGMVIAKYIADVVSIIHEDVETIDMFGLEACFVNEVFKKIEKLTKLGKNPKTCFFGALSCKNTERVLVRLMAGGEIGDLVINDTDDLVKWALAFAMFRLEDILAREDYEFAEYVRTYVSNIYRHMSGRELLGKSETDTLVERLAS